MQAKFENLENSEMKVTVDLSKDEFEKFRPLALERVQSTAKIDGFRPGKAPEDLIVKKYGDMVILEEMANLAINETLYTAIIKENEQRKGEDKIMPLTQPKVNITKIAKGEDLQYTATFPVIPDIKLSDYKKIAAGAIDEVEVEMLAELKKKKDNAAREDLSTVSEAEVDQVILDLRKTRAISAKNLAKKSEESAKDEKVDGVDKEKVSNLQEEFENIKEDELPALDDAFAQSFGEKFKTLEDLKNQIRDNLKLEKRAKLRDKRRTVILEKLVENTSIQIPEALIQEELNRMKAQTKAEVEQYGNTWEKYLEAIKKSEAELEKEWRAVANKRVASQLIVNKIAKLEGITADPADIEAESIKIMAQIPNATRGNVESYVSQILINEEVMKFLNAEKEKTSQPKEEEKA